MKISVLSTTLFLASLLLTPLSAQENEEKLDCYEMYNICSIKCETLDNGFTKCVKECDEEYDKCYEKEQKASN